MVANSYKTEELIKVDRDDLIQEGYIGMITAVNRYDISLEKKAKFLTYAYFWIKQKMSNYISRFKVNDDSLNELIGEDKDTEKIELTIDHNDGYEVVEKKAFNEWLRENEIRLMNEKLTLKQREVIELHYGFNSRVHTDKEISEIFKEKCTNIIFIRNQAINELRRTDFMRNLFVEMKGINREEYWFDNTKYIESLDVEIEKYNKLFN